MTLFILASFKLCPIGIRFQVIDASPGEKVPVRQEILPANCIIKVYPGGQPMLQTRKTAILPLVLLFFILSSIFPGAALAAIFDRYADAALGQPDFLATLTNNGGVSAQSLNKPGAVAVGANGRLYVADTRNNRVLSWPSAASFTTHAAADMVFGQGNDFTTNTANKGGVSASSLNHPSGLAVDGNANLYVADTQNNRVLEYDNPAVNDAIADHVLGQSNFITNGTSTPTDSNLNLPNGLAVDGSNNLFVADTNNNRVLKFESPLTNSIADQVFGQPNFTTSTPPVTPSASSLNQPQGVALDLAGNLYVADTANYRALAYLAPLTNTIADHVYGQVNLTSNFENCVGVPAANNLCLPAAVSVDSQGVLYIADTEFDRVLLFYTPLTGSPPISADEVIGQPDFTSELVPNPPYSYCLNYPNALVVDSQRNLYVVDSNNSRVLRFDTVSATGFTYLPINRK
jgi:sugar lactone lactonase YvrE